MTILVPRRRLWLPEWFTAGKLQRNPATGKLKRKAADGKLLRNTASDTVCCCKNCLGTDCSNCDTATTQQFYFESYSGINALASNSCINDGANSANLFYTSGGSGMSGSGCLIQIGACDWEGTGTTNSNIPTDTFATAEDYTGNTSCSPPANGHEVGPTSLIPNILVKRISGQWAVLIYISLGGVHLFIYFAGQATAPSSNCKISGTITVSNSITSYGTYNDTIFGNGTCWAVGTGGSMHLSFNTGCCP